MLFVTSARAITRVLMAVVLFLSVLSLGARFIRYLWGDEGLLRLLRFFDVGEEGSIPTWYSSSALLLCAVLLALIATANRRRGGRHTGHWIGLSIVFWLLSIDEIVRIHQAAGQDEMISFVHGLTGLSPEGYVYFFWVVPGSAFVFVFVLAYLRFLVDLPRETRLLFILAGFLFVLGALGMEMLSARIISAYGIENWQGVGGLPKVIVGVQTSVEEFLEMAGIVVFVYALVTYISTYVGTTVQVRIDGSKNAERGAHPPGQQPGAWPDRTPEEPATEAERAGGGPA